MYRSILLPLDGSVFGEHALPLALEVARRAGAVLHPVHVYQPNEPWRDFESITPYRFEDELAYETDYENEEKRRERAYLTRVARLAGTRGVDVAPELLDGDIADTLRRHAEATAADLVVIATHGRGPLNRAWLGSVADRMLRELTLPILLVHPDERSRIDLNRPPVLDHLLIPLDGSALAESVIAPATDLGRLWDARYTLLTVATPSGFMGSLPRNPSREDDEMPVEWRANAARAYLEHTADRMRGSGSRVDVCVVNETSTASVILETANRLDARAIAMATHGRSGLARLLLGSVADKVVRAATTPVLVHRPE